MRVKDVIIFAVGMLVGSAVTYKGVKTKYEKIAREEIESVKESFAEHKRREEEKRQQTEAVDAAKATLKEKVTDLGYSQDTDKPVGEMPYVISPDEYGDIDEFDAFSLTCFADGVIVDDNDDIMYDAERAIGDALEHFGDWEDDAIHVRNPSRKCDYEILRDLRTYEEFIKANPHKRQS